MKGSALFLSFVFVSLVCFSQDVWEDLPISYNDWMVSNELICKKYKDRISLKNPATISYHEHGAVTLTNREIYRVLTSPYPSIVLDVKEFGDAFDMYFDVDFLSYPPLGPEIPHVYLRETRLCFYAIEIEYIDSFEKLRQETNYVVRTTGNPDREYDWDTQKMELSYPPHTGTTSSRRSVNLRCKDNEYQLIVSRQEVKCLQDVKCIKKIRIILGGGANIEISRVWIKGMTIYGRSLPYLTRAMDYLDKGNPLSASNEITTAINKGLKSYETYLMRGMAYYVQEYYRSAIDDFSTAINYSAANKEDAYYFRGLSKLALDDDTGVSDLRCGGQKGMVFLRENNLLDYVPGQNKKNSKSPASSSKPKKPQLSK